MKDIVRRMIQHEDNVLSHRLSWMLALQGLLVNALGYLWGKVMPALWLIVGFGFISTISFWYSLHISQKAIEGLKEQWQERSKKNDNKDNEDWTPLQSYSKCKTYLMPWRLLPPLVLVLWIVLGLMISGVLK